MKPTQEQLNSFLTSVKQISIDAGKAILDIYNSDDFKVQEKDDKSPLTAADLAAHNLICDALAKISDFPVLSEESAKLDYSTRASWQTYWLVDPLDGTKEFVKRNGEFTVNIALVHGNDTLLGVVHAPVLDWTYYAAEGVGAFKDSPEESGATIKVRDLADKAVIVGSRSHAGDSLKAFLEKVGEHEMISMGSSLKICLIAEGKADLYPRLGLTSEWDTAAAQAVVEQAGGQLTKTDMSRLQYNTKDELLNPFFFVFGSNSKNWADLL